MKKKIGVGVVMVLVAMSIFCCGCMDTAGNQAPAGSQDLVQAEIPAEDVLLSESGIRLIAEELYPFSYLDENGRVAGQSTMVVEEILRRLNQTGTIEMMPWAEGYELAVKGPDVALYSVGRTAEREDLFQWVGPIASLDYTLFAKNGSGIVIRSLDAAKKTGTIGAVTDDMWYQYLVRNNVTNLVGYESYDDCVSNLMDGEIDLWLGSSSNAGNSARNTGYTSLDLETVYSLRTTDTYIAFSPDTPENIVTTWQNALDSIKEDGTFAVLTGADTEESGTGTVILTESSPSNADLALSLIMAETDGVMESVLHTFEDLAVTGEVQSGNWQAIKPVLAVPEEKMEDARMWYALPNGTYYTVVDDLAQSNLKSRSYGI